MNFSFFLALRYLKSRKSQGFFSVMTMFSLLGIMFGVATLIIVMSVMNGFRLDVMKSIVGFNGHISMIAKSEEALLLAPDILEELKQNKNISFFAPLVDQHVMVMANNEPRAGMVKGISFEDIGKKEIVANHVTKGELSSIKNDAIGIGKRMAQRLRIRVGDQLTIISPQSTPGMFGVVPRMASFKVGFIFETGARDYDDTSVFMSLKLAQKFFKMKDSISMIEIFMKDIEDAENFARELKKKWGGSYQIMDWQKANTGFMAILIVERNVMFIVVGLIVLIASFNIITSLVMLVQQKSKDIAILRTIGATRKQIMRTFFFCGALLGVIGTTFGVLIGTTIAVNLDNIRRFLENLLGITILPPDFWLTKMPAVLLQSDILNVIILSISLSFLATLYPSWRAAKMKPVEALRYE